MPGPAESPYPHGCASAVSLSFDDGMTNQLEVAVPILDERSLPSTFYIPPKEIVQGSDDWIERLKTWKDILPQGHEIGNHSLSHICSRAFTQTGEGRFIEDMSMTDIQEDILEADRRLDEILGPSERTYCYPCYLDYVGDGKTRQTYVPFIAEHFIAGRGRGEFANYPLTCSMSYLWSHNVEHMPGSAIIRLIERSASLGQWCILAFHGIDVGRLAVDKNDFLEVCDFLARNRGEIWTAPVVDIARRILEWRNAMADSECLSTTKA